MINEHNANKVILTSPTHFPGNFLVYPWSMNMRIKKVILTRPRPLCQESSVVALVHEYEADLLLLWFMLIPSNPCPFSQVFFNYKYYQNIPLALIRSYNFFKYKIEVSAPSSISERKYVI